MFDFSSPLAFILLPLPLLAYFLLTPTRKESGSVYVPPAIAKRFPSGDEVDFAEKASRMLPVFLWLLLVTALAGPQVLSQTKLLPASGRDIILAIDLSGSMEREDFELDGHPLSRLNAVKRVAEEFITRRVGDRIGLVIFGDKAYFASPLTYDLEAVARTIAEASIGISGRSTAIGDGLGLTLKRLQASNASSRVVILLSDGVSTAGSVPPVDVGVLAASRGITVHTIALGPDDLESDPNSRDAVDTATLRTIAAASGGETFRVRTLSDLVEVAEAIDRLEPNLSERPPLTVYRDYWTVPATLAFFIALFMTVQSRRYS